MAALTLAIAMRRNGLVYGAVITRGDRAGSIQVRTVQFVALRVR